MSITPRSGGHNLADLDYEARVIGGLLQDYEDARVAIKRLEPGHFAHPYFAAIFSAIRAIEAQAETPSIAVVRERLVASGYPAAMSLIDHCNEQYIESADGFRLHLFAGRILALAALRWFLALANQVESTLVDQRLDRSSQIVGAYEAMSGALAKLGGETGSFPR